MTNNWSQLRGKVQHENQNMSNKLKESEYDVRKTKNLHKNIPSSINSIGKLIVV
jgi:hypothetical protein